MALLLVLAMATASLPPRLARADGGQQSPSPPSTEATGPGDSQRDAATAGGWFYSQESRLPAGDASHTDTLRGYTVTDDAAAAFWTAFRRYGGVAVLGYPLSRRFRYPAPDGYLHQAFQRGILQWRPQEGRAVLANVLDMFTDQGLDDRLEIVGIPRPAPAGPLPFADDAARRMGWVMDPQLVARYLTDPVSGAPFTSVEDAWEMLGLPQGQAGRVQRPDAGSGQSSFVAQRFQKGVLEAFSESRPDDATVVPGDGGQGCVSLAAVGRLARALGSGKIIPSTALALEPTERVASPRLAAFVATRPAGARTAQLELFGQGFDPGKAVTVRLVPVDNGPAEKNEQVASAASDGSFSRSIQAPVGAYTVSARAAGAASTPDPHTDLTIDLRAPTRFGPDASTSQPC